MQPQTNRLLSNNILPPQLTPMIDRKEELARLSQLLTASTCRLLTLVGPGGIGKTRLALRVAAVMQERFPDGVYFVPLQAIDAPDLLCTAIADVLGVALTGQAELLERLSHHLRDKHLLLVLDNVEQLLTVGGAEIIAGLVENANHAKILVTSREVLNLQEEWLFPVAGLAYPPLVTAPVTAPPLAWAEGQAYGAIELFVECARRVQPTFAPEQEMPNLVRICQLVQGMPLALELAASWVKSLPVTEIAAEIERDLTFLTSSLRNTPERHRSMQTVFHHSWAGLTPEEQMVFKRLALFRGGFRRQAAEAVADATLPLLSALVDKSLLRYEHDGRYQLHELLRQYAAEQLTQCADETAATHARHSTYYMAFLQQRADSLMSERQTEVLGELNAELDNIRAAWWWAVTHKDFAKIGQAVYTFSHFYNLQGRFREGVDALTRAVAQIDNTPNAATTHGATLALLNALLGVFYPRLGQFAQSRHVLERSRALLQQLGLEPPPGIHTDPTLGLALLHSILGNYDESRTLAEMARRRYEQRDNPDDLFTALYVLSDVAIVLGDYAAAWRYTEQLYTLAETAGNRWQMAITRRDLGRIARNEGDTRLARHQLELAYTLMDANHDPEGRAVVLNHLGKTAWLAGAYNEAEEYYSRSLALYRTLDDQGGLAMALCGMGDTRLAQGQLALAHNHLRQALTIAAAIGWARLTPEVLVSLSDLFQRLGQPERSVALLTLVVQEAGAMHETRLRAHQQLQRCQAVLTAPEFAAATQQGLASELVDVLALLPLELVALVDVASVAAPVMQPSPTHDRSANLLVQPLVEPLTNRELEVLHLIADGLSNQQIADKLVIALGTVKFYAGQIYGKLGVNNRVQAIMQARELALLN